MINKRPVLLALCAVLLCACAKEPAVSTPTQPENLSITDAATTEKHIEGFALTVGDVRLIPGAMTDVEAALGTAADHYEAPSCVHDGNDIVYVYDFGEIMTSPGDGGSYIASVTVLPDAEIATEEGLTIGASVEEMLALYGACEEEFGRYVYTRGETTLTFLTTDGAVTGFSYAYIGE